MTRFAGLFVACVSCVACGDSGGEADLDRSVTGGAAAAAGSGSNVGGMPAVAGAGGGGELPPSGGGRANAGAGGRATSGGTSSGGAASSTGGASSPGSGGTATTPLLERFRLVVIGSSTSAGQGASSRAKGWVGLLEAALEQRVATRFDCDNLSVGGYSTDDLAAGSDEDGNIDQALELEPDLVVVALAGSNDLSAGTTRSEFLSRLEALRERGEARGVPVFFLTTAPKDIAQSDREELADWAESIEERLGSCRTPLDESYSPCVIDVFAPLANDAFGVHEDFGAGDGIHLNDEGHAAIYAVAREVIEPYVCALTRCD